MLNSDNGLIDVPYVRQSVTNAFKTALAHIVVMPGKKEPEYSKCKTKREVIKFKFIDYVCSHFYYGITNPERLALICEGVESDPTMLDLTLTLRCSFYIHLGYSKDMIDELHKYIARSTYIKRTEHDILSASITGRLTLVNYNNYYSMISANDFLVPIILLSLLVGPEELAGI